MTGHKEGQTPPVGPRPETADEHTGRDDVSHGLNSNLDADMGSTRGDQQATEEIVDQQRQDESEK